MDYIDVPVSNGGVLVVVGGLVFVLALWMIIAPGRVWRIRRPFVAWQYRHGDRLELNTAGRLWTRFSGVLMIGLIALVTGIVVTMPAEYRVETETGLSATAYYVGDPVQMPGCTVRLVVCLRYDKMFRIEIIGYEVLASPEDGHPDLRYSEHYPDGTNLVLHVGEEFFPIHLAIDEVGSGRVTLSVYGKCAPRPSGEPYGGSAQDCESDPSRLLPSDGLIPVALEPALGGRSLIDGFTGAPVAESD